MALQIEKTQENGVVTNYHRIVSIDVDFQEREARVVVASYTGQQQRELEKDAEADYDEFYSLRKQLDELVAVANEDNEAERLELSNQINAIFEEAGGMPTLKKLSVSETLVKLEVSSETDEFTRPILYEHLAGAGQAFEGATEI